MVFNKKQNTTSRAAAGFLLLLRRITVFERQFISFLYGKDKKQNQIATFSLAIVCFVHMHFFYVFCCSLVLHAKKLLRSAICPPKPCSSVNNFWPRESQRLHPQALEVLITSDLVIYGTRGHASKRMPRSVIKSSV